MDKDIPSFVPPAETQEGSHSQAKALVKELFCRLPNTLGWNNRNQIWQL